MYISPMYVNMLAVESGFGCGRVHDGSGVGELRRAVV
jgi:hypothetical protein